MKKILENIINLFKKKIQKENVDNMQEEDNTLENNDNNNEIMPESTNNIPETVIYIDNGHGNDTPGKRSPYSSKGIKPELDFYEYKWNREIANEIYNSLKGMGYDVRLLVTEDNDISLKERVNRVNKMCSQVGKDKVILVSVHSNAAGSGSEWKDARGWSAYTTKGTTKSDKLAEYLYAEAEKNFKGLKIRTDKSDGDKDWESDFYILKNTNCPAVLTENFFYDNIEDLKYILSDEGRKMVIKTHVDGIINYLNAI